MRVAFAVVESDEAATAIDKFLTERWSGRDAVTAVVGSVHLHCTDADGEWTVAAGSDGQVEVTREHAKGDAALRGTAADLLLVLTQGLPVDAVAVFGDADLAARFVAAGSSG